MKRILSVLCAVTLAGIFGFALFGPTAPDVADASGSAFLLDKPYAAAVCSTWINDASRPDECSMTPPTGFTYFDEVHFTAHVTSAAETIGYTLYLSSATDSTAGMGYVKGVYSVPSAAAGVTYTLVLPIRCKKISVYDIDTTDDLGCIGFCSK